MQHFSAEEYDALFGAQLQLEQYRQAQAQGLDDGILQQLRIDAALALRAQQGKPARQNTRHGMHTALTLRKIPAKHCAFAAHFAQMLISVILTVGGRTPTTRRP